MKTMRSTGIGIALCMTMLLSAAGRAQDGAGCSGAGYLTLPVGARSIAMGEVGSSLAGEPFGWLYNPATLHGTAGSGIGLFHSEWIMDTRYNTVDYSRRFNGSFAANLGLVYTYRPDIQGYDGLGDRTKLLKSYNYQVVTGLGFTPVPSFTTGANIKIFREKLDEWSAGGFAVDLGALYSFTEAGITAGFSIQNLGPDVKFDSLREPLPLTVRAGAAHGFAFAEDRLRLLYTFDLVKPRFESLFLSAGAELEIRGTLALRIGYCGQENRAGDGLTAGGGVKLKERLGLDYAWAPHGDLGSLHMISLFFVID